MQPVRGFKHFIVVGNKPESGNDGDGAVEDEEVPGIRRAQAEGTVERAQGGQ